MRREFKWLSEEARAGDTSGSSLTEKREGEEERGRLHCTEHSRNSSHQLSSSSNTCPDQVSHTSYCAVAKYMFITSFYMDFAPELQFLWKFMALHLKNYYIAKWQANGMYVSAWDAVHYTLSRIWCKWVEIRQMGWNIPFRLKNPLICKWDAVSHLHFNLASKE